MHACLAGAQQHTHHSARCVFDDDAHPTRFIPEGIENRGAECWGPSPEHLVPVELFDRVAERHTPAEAGADLYWKDMEARRHRVGHLSHRPDVQSPDRTAERTHGQVAISLLDRH